MKRRAYVGLGGNVGDVATTLRAAVSEIAALPRTALVGCSSTYRTAPLDAGGADYLNAVVAVDTKLDPHALLAALLAIEQRHGRERPHPNAPRTLDLDLLLVDELAIESSQLVLPHPRMHERAFVLVPLAEIAADVRIPGRGPLAPWLQKAQAQRIERIDASIAPDRAS